MNYQQEIRQKLDLIEAQLIQERSTYFKHWHDLGRYILPMRPRWVTSDRDQGDRRRQYIIDPTATLAVRTLRSGMMSGITSPARPWFRLTTTDPDLAEFDPVKEWLDLVTRRISDAFLRSNLYRALSTLYGDLGVFGTSAILCTEGDPFRFVTFPVGSFCIAQNEKLEVDTFYREWQMTVRQVVEMFGRRDEKTGSPDWTNISSYVKNQWERGYYQSPVDVAQIIMPNENYDPDKMGNRFKKYSSFYYEKGTNANGVAGNQSLQSHSANQDKILLESGFDVFPIMAPRWETTGFDVYASSCPGMEALGDIRQLQLGEKRAAQAIEKMIFPPMTGPESLRQSAPSILPGKITYHNQNNAGGFRPVHEVNFRIEALENKQAQVRTRIQRAFYEDLFLMLASSDRRQITAREIEERHEEKLLALGPVLEQLNQDLLDPLIDNAFDKLSKSGEIPEPPEEIQGQELKVQYVSMMAQAQKLVSLGGNERFAGFVMNMASANPQVADNVNWDEVVREYGDITGVPTKLLQTREQVELVRQQRARQMQAERQAEMAKSGATAAKDLSSADVSGDNALRRLVMGN